MKKRILAFLLAFVLCAALLPSAALAAQRDGWYYPTNSDAENDFLSPNHWYYFEKGQPVTGWKWVGGAWYYFDADGVMQTGWLEQDGTSYYLDANGAMATGWRQVGSVWYYLSASGAMVTGWYKIGGRWYFFDEDGAMQTGWLELGGKEYYLSDSGAMVTGWYKIGGRWFYFNPDGSRLEGWLKYGNSWYYLRDWGLMVNRLFTEGENADGPVYYADASGRVSSYPYTGWNEAGGVWGYYKNGLRYTGWLKYGGRWYYMRPGDGSMLYSCCEEISGVNYIFTDSGALSAGGWVFCTRTDPEAGFPDDNHWYYANTDGTARTGWLYLGGAWYYLDPAAKGAMVTGDMVIDGVSYSFRNNGALIQ